jgi:hypothetical protein
MSINNNNPFLLNIIPTENTIAAASGLDPFATLRTDVTNIQQMVIFDEKRIAVDTINAFNNNQVEIINNVNIGSSQTNNAPDAELTVNGLPVGGSIDITTITTTIINILSNSSILSSNAVIEDILTNISNLSSSLASDLLQSNTYNYTFKPSSIGGTDIRDKLLGTPDTITNAFAKVDNWLFTNMIAPPPVSIFISSDSTPTTCKVSWSNPYQFLIGFLAEPFPYISELYINISNADGTFSLSSNISTPSNMPFPGNSNVISNVMLTLDTGTYTSGYSSDNTYIIANAAATGKSDFIFNITWLNKNTSLQTNTLSISNLNFGGGSAPSAPTGLNVTGRTNTTINLNYSAPVPLNGPLLHYSNEVQTFFSIPYTNSFNSASSAQPAPRRYGAAFTSNSVATIITGLNTIFSGLAPDTAVRLSSAARNTINPNYTQGTDIYSRTTLPVAPSRLGAFVFPGGNYYGTQGIPINNRQLGAGQTIAPIINRNTVEVGNYLTTIESTNVAIHTASNPGSGSNSIMSLTCGNVGPILFNGYGGTQVPTDYYGPDDNFLIKFNGSNDFYAASSGSNGFYTVGRFQFGLRRNYIVPSTESYTFTTVQSNEYVSPNITYTTNLYVDEINTAPTLIETYNYVHTQGAGTAYFFCSGVLSFNSNLVINSTFYLSNIGAYFITYPRIGTYTLGSGSTSGPTSNILTGTAFYSDLQLTNLIDTATTLANSNIYIGSNLFNLGNQQLFTNGVDGKVAKLTTSFSNILGTQGLQTVNFKIYSNAGFCNIYFDIPSKSILDSMNTSNSIYGIRVTSGVNNGTDVTDFGGAFNQATSLITYSNEIQLVNGFFQSKASSTDGYINYSSGGFYNPLADSGSYTYPNYGTITTSGEIRYLTVQYYITTPGSYLFFTLNIIGAINFQQDLYTGSLLNDITVQYKILDPVSSNPANTENITSAWLNGNIGAVTGVNNVTKSISGNAGFWFNPNIRGVTYNSTSIKRYLQVTSGTGTTPFLVYIRIGVPMNQNVKWKQLTVSFL